jgi:hypothetical protein
MSIAPQLAARIAFLVRVIEKECLHLASTDQRIFANTTASQALNNLDANVELGERVEAFVGRFARLQDTLGDKLLPLLLTALGEKPSAVLDNLDRAERLNLIRSADEWLTMRGLRNQMVHEYVEDPQVLINALQSGHEFVPVLLSSAQSMVALIKQRGWLL